MSYNEKSN